MTIFSLLIDLQLALVAGGMIYVYAKTRDVFHPLFLILPTFGFIYGLMPFNLDDGRTLTKYFTTDQLIFVQSLNCAGTLAFILGATIAGMSVLRPHGRRLAPSASFIQVLVTGATVLGAVALGAWTIGLVNVGGFMNAFGKAYAGGWDDSGYIRDITIWMLGAIVLLLLASTFAPLRSYQQFLLVVFASPWIVQALLTARRGPTFMFMMILAMSFYLNRNRRPSLVKAAGAGVMVGYLILFLVVNRSSLYLGSDLAEVNTEVGHAVAADDTGNEYIYGTGSVIAADKTAHHFWGRRYLAQVMVRPIPSAIWPTKYQDFGVPELLLNGGTGEGFLDNLGWEGAVGSAPGIIADLWLEGRWFFLPGLFAIGWLYAWLWRRAIQDRGPWISQYIIAVSLSLYLVMQTMEAVIFRFLLLSIPLWVIWRWANYVGASRLVPVIAHYRPAAAQEQP
jgi:hypothetical protein